MINEKDARERFSETFLFDGINKDTADHIISLAKPEYHSYSGGKVIYSPNNFKRALGFILSGEVFVKTPIDCKNVILRTLSEGDMFGSASLFDHYDTPYVSVITARVKTDVMLINQAQIEGMIENYKDIALNYIDFLSQKIRFLNNRISILTSGKAEYRVVRFLLDAPIGDVGECVLPKISTLAYMLDLGRASVYRALDTLVDEKLIVRCNSGKIYIPSRDRLLNYLGR